MYLNDNGSCKIVDESTIKELMDERKKIKGNVIYCKRIDNNYFFKDETFASDEELNMAVAECLLKGYQVYYHADTGTNRKRNN